MIPGKYRLNGSALQLGTEVHGKPGPFGTWIEQDSQEPTREPDDRDDEPPRC